MRKNRTKHEAKKPRLAKRALALCFALIFVCSCLLPVFAHSEENLLTQEAVAQQESVDNPTEGGEDPVLLNEGGEDSNEEPKNEEPKPVEPEQKPEEPKIEETKPEGTTEGNEQPKTEGTTEESKNTTGETKPEETKPEEPKTEETKPEEPKTEESKDTAGETKTEETKPEQQPTTNTTGDTINQGEATYTYRFWPDKIDAFDLEAINADVKSGTSLNDAAQSRAGKVPCTVLTVMTNANLRDYQANVQQPTKDGYEFAGWYTVDGTTEDEFSFEQNLNFEESQTIDVFAKWEKVESTVEDEMEKTEPATEDELEKTESGTESGKANESKDETLLPVEGAVGLMNNEGHTVSIAVKAENLPGKVNKLVVTDLNDDEEEGAAFDSAFRASSYTDWTTTNLMVNITPKDIDGKTVQPSGAVRVTISDLSQLSIGTESIGEWKVLHLTKNNEIEALNVENTTTAVDSYGNTVLNSITFETTSFSPFVVVAKGKVVKTLDLNVRTVEIVDDTKVNGCYRLKVLDNSGKDITTDVVNSNDYSVVWTCDGVEVQVKTKDANGTNKTNLALKQVNGQWVSSGAWLNVAYDMDGLTDETFGKNYTVTVKNKDGMVLGSDSATVSWYSSLQNGSFENPIVGRNNYDGTGHPQVPASNVPAWNTTESNGNIELGNITVRRPGRGDTDTALDYGVSDAPDEKQFAELNADDDSILYQDVLTVPGATMNYSLYHRARWNVSTGNRYGEDTMYLVIAPLELVDGWSNNEIINFVHNSLPVEGWNYYSSGGKTYQVFKQKYSTNAFQWHKKGGTIKVPSGQYTTRFFFASGQTANDNNKLGNFLDKVWFSQKTEPVENASASVTVTKNVYGLTLQEVKQNLSNRAFIQCNSSVDSVVFENASWSEATDPNGKTYVTASRVVTVTGIIAGTSNTYTFTEDASRASVDGYEMTADKESDEITVGGGGTNYNVTFTNTYTPATTNLTVSKAATKDNVVDTTTEFDFTLTLGEKSLGATWTKGTESGTINKTTHKFTLKGGESITFSGISVEDDSVKVEEASVQHYTTTIKVNGEAVNNAAISADTLKQHQEAGTKVEFTNAYTTPKLPSMTIKKVVTGAFGERTKDFTFSVTLTDKNNQTVTDVSHSFSNPATRGGLNSFTLKHGESVKLENIPINTTITITETNANDYKTSATDHGESKDRIFVYEVVEGKDGNAVLKAKNSILGIKVDKTVKDNAIIVTNNFDGTPDTGVLLDTLPYLILLAVAVAGGVLVVVRKRKHRDE